MNHKSNCYSTNNIDMIIKKLRYSWNKWCDVIWIWIIADTGNVCEWIKYGYVCTLFPHYI